MHSSQRHQRLYRPAFSASPWPSLHPCLIAGFGGSAISRKPGSACPSPWEGSSPSLGHFLCQRRADYLFIVVRTYRQVLSQIHLIKDQIHTKRNEGTLVTACKGTLYLMKNSLCPMDPLYRHRGVGGCSLGAGPLPVCGAPDRGLQSPVLLSVDPSGLRKEQTSVERGLNQKNEI